MNSLFEENILLTDNYFYNWSGRKDYDPDSFFDWLMNISPHLLIDVGILSTALTITLLLRAKGNAARKERESKWMLIDSYSRSTIVKNYQISDLINRERYVVD